MPTCLDNIVGVTDKITIPFYADLEAGLKTAIATSSSGLYLDSLPGGIDLMAVDDETYMPSVLQLGVDATNNASKILNDELLLAINNRFKAAKTKYIGFIGRRTVSATSSSSGNIQGHRYRMHEPIAGNIAISAIGVNVNGAATFNVYIGRREAYDTGINNRGIQEVLHTLPVTTVANTWTNATLPSGGIKLPMEIDGVAQEYYIYWKRDEAGGLFAKNNDMKCGTCGSAKANDAISNFMHYNGISYPNTDNVVNGSTDKLGHGLSVSAVVGCDHTMVICREYNKKEVVQLMMDRAALYKAGELWIEYIIKSGYINKENMQNREYLWGKRNHFQKEFNERITAIANAMELGETNCYVCKDDTMFKGTIFS
jgi:hypothetical protein